jgi:hypothetical protein
MLLSVREYFEQRCCCITVASSLRVTSLRIKSAIRFKIPVSGDSCRNTVESLFRVSDTVFTVFTFDHSSPKKDYNEKE